MGKTKHSKNKVSNSKFDKVCVFVAQERLSSLTDEEIYEEHQRLESHRTKMLSSDVSTRTIEEEISYIQREIQLRNTRHDKHTTYLSKLDEDTRQAIAIENSLPSIDFSNVEFVRLHNDYVINHMRTLSFRA